MVRRTDTPQGLSQGIPSFDYKAIQERYLALLLAGGRREATKMIMDAMDQGADLKRIYLDVFQPALHTVGKMWMRNEITVAKEHFCTASTQSVMAMLYPRLFQVERKGLTAVAACVGGELHELGVRMVADFLELEGWDTYYLGANTPDKDVVAALLERNADLLALSVTMPYNVYLVQRLIQAVRAEPGLKNLKIMVGGYPFAIQVDLYRAVGADATAGNAEEALAVIGALMQ
jgi:methanogenic corrinoid protein MtbC1